ncbi:hypothetical protein C1H46_006663 [Malus baccata]|uniref:lipid-A-disaccharide synthase n=1 Tax=Malus baccata TaxID=106549 RepID=A0A540NB62_MALBA|nr:hypothetical protein C1H46_006663 [Malus baccata]
MTASRLMASLKNLFPVPVRFSGFGGLMMTNQGLKSLFSMEDIAVMRLLELLLRLNMIRVKLQETIEAALRFQPHVVVTVDSKGFSFRLLKQLRAPSFWAWKGGEARLRGLVQFVDHVLCVLPSEEEVCRSNGLAATFVGHPSLEDVWELNSFHVLIHNLVYRRKLHPMNGRWKIQGNCEDFRRKYAMPAGAKVISLLPGSRLQEITRMLSIFTYAMALLQVSFPNQGTHRLPPKWSHGFPPIVPEALFQACTPTNLASLMLDLIHDNGV